MSEAARTPLFDLHEALGGTMVDFAGYALPVRYPLGVMKEHLHTRAAAGLFDVSHMGQIAMRPKSGDIADAARALEALVPVSVLALGEGRQRYALFTNDDGGILDDLMVANRGDHLFLVVNAACKDADIAHLKAHLSDTCLIEPITDRALVALQGPEAELRRARLAPGAAAMTFMDVADVEIEGAACIVSRSGYTGEDGYEISCPAGDAETIARALLAMDEVEAIGLGARDSLRLESGLCLYGHDLDTTTTPVEGALAWAIQKVRRRGGDREGGFPGAQIILDQLENGAPRKRVGLLPEGRAPIREGAPIFAAEDAAEPVGAVTSGGFAPTLGAPVAMGYVPAALSAEGTRVFAEVRGKKLPMIVAQTPFITQNYKR